MKKKRIRAAVVIAVVLVFRGGFCRRKYVVNSTAYILDTDLGTGGIYQGTREGSFFELRKPRDSRVVPMSLSGE